VRARNGLAARLRKAGQIDAAAEVARLRKPSAPLWAINQLARTDPGAIARLIDATDALRDAQLGRPPGGDPSARTAAQRAALEGLVDRAASLIHPGGADAPADTRARLSASLLGAAADARLREDLRRGRLARAAADAQRAAATATEAAERAREAASQAGASLRAAEGRLAAARPTRVE
jgi:hypothetical protein